MDEEKNDLKPCPFCSGNNIKAFLVTWAEGGENYKPNWAIGCLDCGGGFHDIFETEKQAKERWNLRNEKSEEEKARDDFKLVI